MYVSGMWHIICDNGCEFVEQLINWWQEISGISLIHMNYRIPIYLQNEMNVPALYSVVRHFNHFILHIIYYVVIYAFFNVKLKAKL